MRLPNVGGKRQGHGPRTREKKEHTPKSQVFKDMGHFELNKIYVRPMP